MPRYASMIVNGMNDRGHNVEIWKPKPLIYKLPLPFIKKWLGYIDQYVIFPISVKLSLSFTSKKTLFVFADNALGPWIPLLKKRPRIVHCHDFLAQKSALGMLEENPTSFTGQLYQRFIRWGYQKGENFISISQNTQKDLHHFLDKKPKYSTVIYNGLNRPFSPTENVNTLRNKLSTTFDLNLKDGYIVHVGGNQFYKNRIGVLEIYERWVSVYNIKNIPLILIGSSPTSQLLDFKRKSKCKDTIYFLSGLSDEQVQNYYQGATTLLYPSLYEGFGWPIAEAMASGCPVITTNEAPMNEVGDEGAYYIEKKPMDESQLDQWINESAKVLQEIVGLKGAEKKLVIEKMYQQAAKFNTKKCLDQIEQAYQTVMERV